MSCMGDKLLTVMDGDRFIIFQLHNVFLLDRELAISGNTQQFFKFSYDVRPAWDLPFLPINKDNDRIVCMPFVFF